MIRTKITATILALATLALGACSTHKAVPAAAHALTPSSLQGAPFISPAVKDEAVDYSTPKPPKIAMPRWKAERSDIGGFPFPRGWHVNEVLTKGGYERSERYAPRTRVTLEQLFIWYRAQVPQDKPWGDWTPCFPAGNGGGLDQYGRQGWWAFHSSRNPDHVITIDVGEAENGQAGLIIARSIDNECQ